MPTYNTLSHRAFNLLCFHDVELGEAFLQRVPNTSDVPTLNHHLRVMLSSMVGNTFNERALLDDHLDQERWLCVFNNHLVPLFLNRRLPPETRRVHNPYYATE